ncbi:hypothetical protein NS220_11190 [Microbacterium testaceum]|uniref:Uncharacterized protein n=1 Tax=Microbacterium testaceum TaxID=2033 RepID=A0A147EVZ0_MICTE|nr:hypothetical protein NS220_11190 [Microbacterium testaceum]
MARFDDAEREHQKDVVQVVAAAATNDAGAAAHESAAPIAGGTHGLVVVQERWRWMPVLVSLNFFWVVMSAAAAASKDSGAYILILLFPEIPAFRYRPEIPITVTAIILLISVGYAVSGKPGSKKGLRFVAALTMSGAVVAIASFALSAVVMASIPFMWNLH